MNKLWILLGGVVLVSWASFRTKRVTSPTPTPTPTPETPKPYPVSTPRERRGETAYSIAEARFTEQKTSGWEKTGKSVIYVPSIQSSGKTVGTYKTNPKTAGEFFALYGPPSLYWSDLSQWEWGNAPRNIIQVPQDQRAFATRTPEYA